MALPSNDKIIGDLGHTADHNAIVDEIIYIKQNYLTASGNTIQDLLRRDVASATYLSISNAASAYIRVTSSAAIVSGYIPTSASQSYLTRSDAAIVYAPRASASFTGTPTAPTASPTTNTQQIATTQFVRTEITNLISSAPATLDTLNELASALGNDPNFATSTASAIGQRLLASTASTLYLGITNTANHSRTASSIAGSLVTGTVSNATNASHSNTASSIAGSLITGIVNNSNHANTASSINWSGVTSKPNLVTSVTGGSGITVGGTSTDPIISLNSGASVSWGNVSSKPSPIIGVNLVGDITGAASATLTQLSNGQISISTTIGPDSVILGTDTTGNYVAGAIGGTGITITGAAGEGWSPTINVDATASVSWANVSGKPSPIIGINLTGNTIGAASATLSQLTNGQISISTNTVHASTASSINWAGVTGRPTTLSGYGITDAASLNSPNFIGVPTAPTASAGSSSNQIANTEFVNSAILSVQSGSFIDLSSYLKVDSASVLYLGINNTANHARTASSISWSLVTNRPSASPNLNPQIGINLVGDITGAASVTLTSLTNGQISINTTVAANSVALGTDTTGNYVAGATAGDGITISGTAGEGWLPTISVNTAASVSWNNVSNKPTTFSGYGLTDDTIDCGGP